MAEKNVQQQIENIIKGLRYLDEHVECVKQRDGWEAEMEFILSLVEELGIKLEIIVERAETCSSGENSME